ncbi:Cytochrome c oxidase assembly protein cox18, mitochondrial [Schizosaccharomyces pombe]|uniref:Cytochrome c oxidase assembly protein cox18, mitochondrial n=1 Tax=Schizosaccharomyces pombe (strain 972 / ATCC 24843) TaxID=284812 RepID=COX18_SCHPO|nr:protein Cox18 [Schizosaccharomyces pombe]O94587.1 RecName: Full=Cytochrome c oxidase assembly protein cox18, mitochondrial; AltName: Full=Sp3; AltName: Full=cox18sp+; Flags: Precursor [Schizosaccharomyces pombe 972h-]CAA21449.1 mitochondrial inner membrane protein Cox18 [Schizosaccharomyces pombe]|eukprot:NP_588329.1 protein Cox18 [Schizosaccharomyces pombe]
MLQTLIGVHSYMPWCYEIPAMAIFLRSTITLPIAIASLKTARRFVQVQPLIKEAKKRCRTNTDFRTVRKKLYKRFNCHPLMIYALPITQLPLFAFASYQLRQAVDVCPESMSTEGMLWFTDLTLPDPHGVLPAVLAVTYLTNMSILKRPSDSRLLKIFNTAGIMSAFFVSFMAFKTSTALSLYWTTSAIYSLVQNVALRKLL